MCGRFAVTTDPARLAEEIGARDETGLSGPAVNYNVAPTTDVAAVVARHDDPDDPDDPDGEVTRRLRLMRWGLLPPWVKAGPDGAPRTKAPLINARAESATTSPAFRSSAARRRCLVPMDGYYEWQPDRGRKTPFYFYRPDGQPLLVAGLWSVWKPDEAAAPLRSCTIITTDAPARFAAVHDRMPLVLGPADWDRWLDPDAPAPTDVLAGTPDVSAMDMREVSTLVNNVANNGAELIEAVGGVNQPVGLF